MVNYLSSEEIDHDFLWSFEHEYPGICAKEFELKDPYTGATQKYSLNSLIYDTQLYSKFQEEGEKWQGLYMIVGEGSKEENISLAKQVLGQAISALHITRENINMLGDGISLATQFLSPVGSNVGLAVDSALPDIGWTIGAGSEKDLSANGSIEDNIKNGASDALAMHNMIGGVKSNMDYGLVWKMISIQAAANYLTMITLNSRHC